MKRRAFRHEREVRLLYFGDVKDQDEVGLYRYQVDPHAMITQIMADPNRDRREWTADKKAIAEATGFRGDIKRSMIYDPPEWQRRFTDRCIQSSNLRLFTCQRP